MKECMHGPGLISCTDEGCCSVDAMGKGVVDAKQMCACKSTSVHVSQGDYVHPRSNSCTLEMRLAKNQLRPMCAMTQQVFDSETRCDWH